MKPIRIGPNTYTSIASAWRETGKQVPLITIRWRLRNGWDTFDAFFTPIVPPEDRRRWAQVRSNINEVIV